jgi:lysyl-tRNA synthetase class 2
MQNNTVTSAIETERLARIEKAEKLRDKGVDPYSAEAKRDYVLAEVKAEMTKLKDDGQSEILKVGQEVVLTGRIKALRLSGKIGFTTMEDESCPEGFQFLFKSDLLTSGALNFDDLVDLVDKGDYIEAKGVLDFSQRGEASLFVHEFKVLTKALRTLPEKLEDPEFIYRQRYVDMKLNSDVRDMFRKKSRFWAATREFLTKHEFLEVQAPTIEHTTGGAEAKPFKTYHNALDEDFYLRISSELFLKRYIVGGFEKVFDIDKNFRNEGMDDEHLQEYLQVEFYWAYAGHNDLLLFTEKLIKYIIKETFGELKLDYKGQKVDWGRKWPVISYFDFIEQFGGISLKNCDSVEELRDLAKKYDIKYDDGMGYGRMMDLIYKKLARPNCIEPVWLTDHPVFLSPLAKKHPNDSTTTLRMQLVAYGTELANGYCELNDPMDQLSRFREQQTLREGGDDEAMMFDDDFVRALEYGMPPTVGMGFSERLFAVLMQKSVRETTAFPLLRRIKD